MRRLIGLVPLPLVLGVALTLTACSGGQPSNQTEGTPAKASPARVVEGMHYVQLFNTVDPVLAHLQASGIPPSAAELQSAASSLRQFATQARGLPSGASSDTKDQLASASSKLAGQLSTLAAKGTLSSDATSGLSSAVAEFQSAAAAARKDTRMPAVKTTSPKPQADTGP